MNKTKQKGIKYPVLTTCTHSNIVTVESKVKRPSVGQTITCSTCGDKVDIVKVGIPYETK